MAESVIIQQTSNFETQFFSLSPKAVDSETFISVRRLHALTPYGMMLASLGSCTAMVIHTYAQNHGLVVDEVEIRLHYYRKFQEDCENCENVDHYNEHIDEEISFRGQLSEEQQEKLFEISHQCPIHKMYEDGVAIHPKLREDMRNRFLV